MKKLLTLFLLAALLLTACSNPNPPIDETTTDAPSGNETTLAPPDDDTTTTEDTETTTPENIDTTVPDDTDTTTLDDTDNIVPDEIETSVPPEFILESELNGTFRCLSDFYMFAMTESRDPISYKDEYVKDYIGGFPSVEPEALLKIEDLFSGIDLSNDIECVTTAFIANKYNYVLKSGVEIMINYNSEKTPRLGMTTINKLKYVQEDEENRFLPDSEVNAIYTKEVNGITVYRMRYKTYYHFGIIIGDYSIELHTCMVDTLNDPENPFVKTFFEGSELDLSNAVAKLISCVNNKKTEN